MAEAAGRTYICIDLKSFYASVECADRGLDPFKDNLVVADPDRTEKTICLAITPAMKALGVRNRCRVFEIPPGISYVKAKPRMRRYMEASADIYSIYLRYVSPDDVHVYSIGECFIDATPYLTQYREFGVNAEFLIDHAWGQEPCTIADIKAYEPEGHSITNGQVLPCDYSFSEARMVMLEMVDASVLELVEQGLAAGSISLAVGYARTGGGAGKGCVGNRPCGQLRLICVKAA